MVTLQPERCLGVPYHPPTKSRHSRVLDLERAARVPWSEVLYVAGELWESCNTW